ncbi:MAG TPA: DUF2934 domain-containing protein [Verrucomicrobiae bacterium]|nr:DUF2934 domain-containing protein [Verrucomicrobiae bacterium]
MFSKVTTLPAPSATEKAVRSASHPTEQQIASRAHQIFLERGATPGLDFDDWLQAERELTAAAAKRHDAPKPSAASAAPQANSRSPR